MTTSTDPGFEPGVGPNAGLHRPPAPTTDKYVHDELYIEVKTDEHGKLVEAGQVYLNDDYSATWWEGQVCEVKDEGIMVWQHDSDLTLEASSHIEAWINFPRTMAQVWKDWDGRDAWDIVDALNRELTALNVKE